MEEDHPLIASLANDCLERYEGCTGRSLWIGITGPPGNTSLLLLSLNTPSSLLFDFRIWQDNVKLKSFKQALFGTFLGSDKGVKWMTEEGSFCKGLMVTLILLTSEKGKRGMDSILSSLFLFLISVIQDDSRCFMPRFSDSSGID